MKMQLKDYGDQIFENYEHFIRENRDDLSTHHGKLEMLSTDGAFKSYIDMLSEGFSPQQKRSFSAIAERQRELILEDVSVGPSSNAFGYAVHSFPILADIYSDPVLSQIATTYPVNKSILTIPRAKIFARTSNSDGTVTTTRLPTTTNLVRSKAVEIVMPQGRFDIFTYITTLSSSTTKDTASINKRYFVINKVTITLSDNTTTDVAVMINPDVRGQFTNVVEFMDDTVGAGPVYPEHTASIVGNINWDTGIIQYSSTIQDINLHGLTPGATPLAVVSITASVVMSPRRGSVGRTTISLEMEGWDINVDVTDDFEIKLDQEKIHDFSDIYNIDLLKMLSTAIKHQMLYNKDYDLAYMLKSHEPVFKINGSYQEYDIGKFVVVGSNFTPASVIDVFRGIVPLISRVNRNIRKIFRADPQYIVAGARMATILESLQMFAVNFQSNNNGESGYQTSQQNIDFKKQMIIACDSIDDDTLYVVYKAPGDLLERTAIADIIYKPLYIIDEIDESQPRTFVKSRTTLQITAPEAIGCIKIVDSGKVLTDPVLPLTDQHSLESLLGI
jgi:hypothetical protein